MYHNCSVRNNVAGSVDSVSKITAEMLNRCYDVFYNPTNMVLVVCGNVTPEAVAAVVDQTLPKDFVGRTIERYHADEPRCVKDVLVETEMVVAKPIFSIGIKDPELIADGEERMRRYAAMSILCDVLFCRSGVLYNTLFEEGLISPDFSFYYSCSDLFAYTAISGEADDPALVLARIKEYIASVRENGLSLSDFKRCQRVLYSEFVKDFDSTEEISYNMIDFIFDDAELLTFGDKLMSVTYEEVCQLLNTAFAEEYFSLSVIRPKKKESL